MSFLVNSSGVWIDHFGKSGRNQSFVTKNKETLSWGTNILTRLGEIFKTMKITNWTNF